MVVTTVKSAILSETVLSNHFRSIGIGSTGKKKMKAITGENKITLMVTNQYV